MVRPPAEPNVQNEITARTQSGLGIAVAAAQHSSQQPNTAGLVAVLEKLVTQYGERLVCVRYRYDAAAQLRYKTVELVIEQLPWDPAQRARRRSEGPGRPPVLIGLRVHFHEEQLRKRVKDAGGRWLPEKKLWVVPIGVARRLGLADRAVAVPDVPVFSAASTGNDPRG